MDSYTWTTLNVKQNLLKTKQLENIGDLDNKERCLYIYFSLKNNIQPDGTVRLPRALWNKYLENLWKAHLNPIQKVDVIRQVTVAKIKYQLRLSDDGFEEARKLN